MSRGPPFVLLSNVCKCEFSDGELELTQGHFIPLLDTTKC